MSNREEFIIAIAILENKWLDSTIIISHFEGTNNIFADGKVSIKTNHIKYPNIFPHLEF